MNESEGETLQENTRDEKRRQRKNATEGVALMMAGRQSQWKTLEWRSECITNNCEGQQLTNSQPRRCIPQGDKVTQDQGKNERHMHLDA